MIKKILFRQVRNSNEKIFIKSPAITYEIGQHFKGNKELNQIDEGNRAEEGSTEYILAHAILGAAVVVAAAGGKNAMTGAIAAASSEAIIPVVSQWLYSTKDPEQLIIYLNHGDLN